MKFNLFQHKADIKKRFEQPRRKITTCIYQQDFNDLVLLMDKYDYQNFSNLLRECLHYGVQNHPEISLKLKKIKEKQDAEKLKVYEKIMK